MKPKTPTGDPGCAGLTGSVHVERETPEIKESVKNADNQAPHNHKIVEYANNVTEESLSHADSAITAERQWTHQQPTPSQIHQSNKVGDPPNSHLSQSMRTTELIFQEFHNILSNDKAIHLSLTPYHEFKLPIITMTINNQKMKVLFDSGSSISILTKKGRNIIAPKLISHTRADVWAANNQKLNLSGETTLTINLRQPVQHKFLVAQNDISGCHALLGTDLFPKLN